MIVDLNQLVTQCAAHIAPNTMIAIVKTESKVNPLAIGLNKGKKLRYQPANLTQAINWVNYLEKNSYDFDVGIAQINIKNIHKYGFKAEDMLDPCKNLQVASYILKNNYKAALNKSNNSHDALLKAISAYNTGNYQSGFNNGYVKKVVINAGTNLKIKSTITKQVNIAQIQRIKVNKPVNSQKHSMIVYAKNREEIEATAN